MTKKPKMVFTSLQHQLRNMKCSEEDDLRQYLDKAQDLFACLNDMGAKMENSEFLGIILGALPPSYESVMSALTTSLEEVGKPIEIGSIIRILKSQYDKKKSVSTTQEEPGFMGASSKKVHICSNCKKKGILLKISGLKAVEKKVKVQNRRRDPSLGRKKGKRRQMQPQRAPVMENLMNQLLSSIPTI